MAPDSPDGPVDGLIADILRRDAPDEFESGDRSELLTFLIADIRGYTAFTQRRGDEAAAKLTAKFAAVVREVVTAAGGLVFEVRGDEALCVFGSARQSLRVGVALQERFVEETASDADLPMPIGIGIDAGEAVRGADGYRGGALNLAARLCGQAKAGEVLASPEVTHLARAIDGLRYVPTDRVSLHGLNEPVRPVRVLPALEDPVVQMAALLAGPRTGRLRRRVRHPVAVGVVGVATAVTTAVGLAVAVRDPPRPGPILTAIAENSVGIVDPGSGHIVGQVAVDAGPSAVISAVESVWTADADTNTVTRVDPTRRSAPRPIPVGEAPSAIAYGHESIWVVNGGAGSVTRIDPETNRTDTPIPVGSDPTGIAVTPSAVWVANSVDGTLSRIDPDRNEETGARIPVGNGPHGLAADGEDVWVAETTDGSVAKVSGRTGQVVRRVRVNSDPENVAVAGDSVWVTSKLGGTLARIARSGGDEPQSYSIGQAPTRIAVLDGRVWVALEAAAQLVEVDAGSARVIRRVSVRATPTGIAVAEGRLWVTTTIDRNAHRGGTLHVSGADPVTLDPHLIQSTAGYSLAYLTSDPLVSYARTTGADGIAIVPDLATAIPEPTGGGRVYTFRLRPDIRWSNGAPVTVRDVRRGLQRAFALGTGASVGAMIVGGRACSTKRCDLPGVAVDPVAGSVRITLVRPNSTFLDALTAAPAVPEHTPLTELTKTQTLAATGPYRVASFVPRKQVVLVRNRFFHEWSAAAQPRGFPDQIVWHIDGRDRFAFGDLDAVAAGRADVADVSNTRYPVVEARFGPRAHVTPSATFQGIALNTHIPPFNDSRARRALALAIDRDAIAADWYAPTRIVCQFLLPGYVGYRPYCPYDRAPNAAGEWHGPDLATAQRLVRESGTAQVPIVVHTPVGNAAAFGHVVDALKTIGYTSVRLAVDRHPLDHYFNRVYDARRKVQAAWLGWIPSSVDTAAQFELWTCAEYDPTDPTRNNNVAGRCDPAFDSGIAHASAVQARTSRAEASPLWTALDRRLTDAAPWIPLASPSSVEVVSRRVHHYLRSELLGPLLDQMWLD